MTICRYVSSDSGNGPILDDDSDMDVDEKDRGCMFCIGLYCEDAQGQQRIRCLQCFRFLFTKVSILVFSCHLVTDDIKITVEYQEFGFLYITDLKSRDMVVDPLSYLCS